MTLYCQYKKCGGDQPRPAEHGPLCHYHYSHLGKNLNDTPELIRTALENLIKPTTSGGERVSGSKDTRPAPVSLAAIDEADELHILIAVTSEAVAPQIHQLPPHITSTKGISTHTTPDQAHHHATGIVRWLLRHLHEITTTPDIVDLAQDLETITRRMRYLWPAAEKERHLPGVPCRECDLVDLWYTPPAEESWPITVQCHSCNYVAPEEDLVRLARLVEYEQESKRRKSA